MRQALLGDAVLLAPMFRAEAEGEVRLDPEYRLREDARWLEYVRQEISRPGTRIYLAAAAGGGAPSGFIHVRLHRAALSARRARLFGRRRSLTEADLAQRRGAWGSVEHLYVGEQDRRAGAAKALMARAVGWLAESGATSVEAGVGAQNPASLALFRSQGFAEVRTVMRKGL